MHSHRICSSTLPTLREIVDPSLPAASSDANCVDDRTKMPTEWYSNRSSTNAKMLDTSHVFAVALSNSTAAHAHHQQHTPHNKESATMLHATDDCMSA